MDAHHSNELHNKPERVYGYTRRVWQTACTSLTRIL